MTSATAATAPDTRTDAELDAIVERLVGDLANVHAPHGSELVCQGWEQEGALRMLLNNLDPDVAEDPTKLVVYGGTGRAARTHAALRMIVKELLRLGADETLLVQSGKPVAVFRTTRDSPRVLIANSNLVPRFATWEQFRELEAQGLTMYGQMTAGSWIYIGTQGILQGTFQTFAAAAREHYGTTDLTGRTILTGGLGGMGGAQPLAATLCGAAVLCIEVDPHRIQRRLETRYLDEVAPTLEEGVARVEAAAAEGRALSVAVLGNCGQAFPYLAAGDFRPDFVTDQTSAHDMLGGYVPMGMSLENAVALRHADPGEYMRLSRLTVVNHVQAMLEFQKDGCHVFDYGNKIRTEALDAGLADAFDFPGFVPAYIRPLFARGIGPFRWAALSGDEADIARIDRALAEAFPGDELLQRWLRLAPEKVAFQGLPARICWLGYGDRQKAGLIFNELVSSGEVSAPIVIGRDHLDAGSVASPFRETEAMRDGSDAIADWPLLNALINTAAGASWVSIHHGGGVGIGNSIHAGMVIVADGSERARDRLTRVLDADPGMGVVRHLDAGYDEALDCADEHPELRTPGRHIPREAPPT